MQAYRSSSLRSWTLIERKPEPTGVVVGPLIPTPVRLIDSRVRWGNGVALLAVDVLARRLLVPLELDPGRLQHPAGGLDELGAGAVAGDQGDRVGHGRRDAIGAPAIARDNCALLRECTRGNRRARADRAPPTRSSTSLRRWRATTSSSDDAGAGRGAAPRGGRVGRGRGARAGRALRLPQTIRWGVEANQNPPKLRTHDRFGNRIDEVEFHPAWHELMRIGIAARPARARPGASRSPAPTSRAARCSCSSARSRRAWAARSR